MEYYTIEKLHPWLYGIHDPMDVYMYLVVGEEKALLYDSAYGFAPISPVIRSITNLPLEVVLSHGHIDHANGSYQFESAWIYEDDKELCLRHTGRTAKKRALDGAASKGISLPENFDDDAYIHSGAGNLKDMKIGQVFDLGGLCLEVVKMEGHTQGSVGLLAQEKRVLLTSDGANPHLWLFLEESTSVSEYIAMLERSLKLEFDTFFIGHSGREFNKEYFNRFISAAKNAAPEKAVPYGALPERKGMIYHEDDVAIVFSKDKLQTSTNKQIF
ncbi:MAG: MBL fold metallo-hydrolase [Defluviitaleaceae bacterium]|nr:MBL fold metallo-hydrolase [Defluviitaleaceae bacterium]